MANFDLKRAGNLALQTVFRYEIVFPSTSSELGISDDITGYCKSAALPRANGEPITWNLPMGPKSYQAGKRTVQPIALEFVVPAGNTINAYSMFENWCGSTFNLNDGTNKGKAKYSVDGIIIKLKDEQGIDRHKFTLYKAQPTEVDYKSVNSEGNEVLDFSITLIYDNYKYESM